MHRLRRTLHRHELPSQRWQEVLYGLLGRAEESHTSRAREDQGGRLVSRQRLEVPQVV